MKDLNFPEKAPSLDQVLPSAMEGYVYVLRQ